MLLDLRGTLQASPDPGVLMRSGQELQVSQGTFGQVDYSWALPALVDIPIMLFFFFQKLMSFLKARKSKRSCKRDRTAAYTLATHIAVTDQVVLVH